MFNQEPVDPYIEHEILAASPIKLRWLLICRAEELCGAVGVFWQQGQTAVGDQWMLLIRDILGELLQGVTSENPVSPKVADFYVFLVQTATEVSMSRNIERLNTIRELLSIEAETWRMLIDRQSQSASQTPTIPATNLSPIAPQVDFETLGGESSFSLDV